MHTIRRSGDVFLRLNTGHGTLATVMFNCAAFTNVIRNRVFISDRDAVFLAGPWK
jgi:hypothetical protein